MSRQATSELQSVGLVRRDVDQHDAGTKRGRHVLCAVEAVEVRHDRESLGLEERLAGRAEGTVPHLAASAGAKPPRRVPKWLARPLAGDVAVTMLTEGRGFSNAKAKRELGWTPRYPSWRQGFADVYADPTAASSAPRSVHAEAA